mgnify:FL=1
MTKTGLNFKNWAYLTYINLYVRLQNKERLHWVTAFSPWLLSGESQGEEVIIVVSNIISVLIKEIIFFLQKRKKKRHLSLVIKISVKL